MKRLTITLLTLLLVIGCSPSEEEVKVIIDDTYKEVKVIPASKPCANLEGYKKLKSLESKYKTNFYSNLTDLKIEEYDKKCSLKLDEEERERKIREEQNKLGDWSIGYFVDEFGDKMLGGGWIHFLQIN